MALTRCPRCGTPVLIGKVAGRDVVYEPQLDPDDSPAGLVWVAHSEDRCEFAGLIAANFEFG